PHPREMQEPHLRPPVEHGVAFRRAGRWKDQHGAVAGGSIQQPPVDVFRPRLELARAEKGEGKSVRRCAAHSLVEARRKNSALLPSRKTSSPNAFIMPSTWLAWAAMARILRSRTSGGSWKSMASSRRAVTGGVPDSMNTLNWLKRGTNSSAHSGV